MNDFNSRYRNIDDQPDTIRTNAGGFDFSGGFGDDMDIMEAENAQKKKQVARASQARNASSKGRKSKNQMLLVYAIIIAVEVVILAGIWISYLTYDGGSKKSNKSESTQESSGGNSGSINVDNDNFTLTCSKIAIATDSTGSPAATVYFSFTNKTDTPLSMSEVYSPSFVQSGVELPFTESLADPPMELFNKEAQVSGGQSIECAYAVTLQDTTSEITITMHDNYETFSDIGTTVVPIS